MLDHNKIGTAGLKALSQGLALNDNITDLSLSYCGLDENSCQYIQQILAFINTKLETLNLQGNRLENKGVRD